MPRKGRYKPLSEAKRVRLGLPYMVGVRIDYRGCYGDGCQVSGFTVNHESDDPETVGGLGDLPRNGVTVE